MPKITRDPRRKRPGIPTHASSAGLLDATKMLPFQVKIDAHQKFGALVMFRDDSQNSHNLPLRTNCPYRGCSLWTALQYNNEQPQRSLMKKKDFTEVQLHLKRGRMCYGKFEKREKG